MKIESAQDSFIATVAARRAVEMAQNVMAAGKSRRIGQIIGDPGTGKSEVAERLAADFGGAYVSAWQTVSVNGLLIELARALGDITLKDNTSNDRVFSVLRKLVPGRLIVVDEANLLTWKHLEALRHLPDQCDAGLVLVGTLLFSDYLKASKASTLVAQLASRIGGKSVKFEAMSERETIAAVLRPRYPDADPDAYREFYRFSGGLWRQVVEMAEVCDRIMAVNKAPFSADVVASAAVSMGMAQVRTAPRKPKSDTNTHNQNGAK